MRKLSGFKKRTITGLILVSIIVPLVAIEGPWFFYLGLFLSLVATYEMMNMFYTKAPSLKYLRFIVPILSGLLVTMVYYSTIKGMVFGSDIGTYQLQKNLLYHFWVIVVFVLSILLIMIIIIFTKGSTAYDFANSIMSLVYCGLIMGYVISIKYIEPIYFPDVAVKPVITKFKGGRSFGYLYAIVIATDVFAYLIGSKFGKRKLCPTISPNKSVEGALGGLVAGGVIGTVCVFLFKMVDLTNALPIQIWITVLTAFFASLFLSFAVQIGDLVASKMKRTYQIKDFGKIFPGHGGVLDRFDSLIFSGACFYLLMRFIQLIVIGVN